MSRPTKHGNKWRIRWVDHLGKRQSAVFDNFKDAQFVLSKERSKAEAIKRGLELPPTTKTTFHELCEYYLKFVSFAKRSKKDDESIIRVHLRPHFGHLALEDLGGHVDSFKHSRVHLNKKTLHNILTLLISMLRVAHEKGWVQTLPKIKKPKIQKLDKDYKYLETKSEIDLFLKSAKEKNDLIFTFYATAIFTGLRAGEVAGLLWTDINFETRLIKVQRSYDGRPTKNNRTRFVPILDVLQGHLNRWRLKSQGKIVFPNLKGNHYSPSSYIFQETFKSVLNLANLNKSIRFHDLRHTFASHWMMNGGDIFKLQKILGHQSIEMTMRYSHLSPTAFQSDFDRFGRYDKYDQSFTLHNFDQKPAIPIKS